MIYLLPVIAMVTKSAGTMYSRWVLRTYRLQPATGIFYGFVGAFILMAFLSPWFGGIDLMLLEPWLVAFLFASVGLGLVANVFSVAALKKESLRNYELVEIVAPFVTMGMAALVYVDEREPIRLALGLLAAGSFCLTHMEGRHFRLQPMDRWLLVGVALFAVETLLIKSLLLVFEPVTYYGLRAGLIALVALIVLRPPLAVASPVVGGHFAATTLLGGLRSIATLYSIRYLGIVMTSLVLLLEPILLAICSRFALRERWSFRQGVGFVVIIGCVVLLEFV